MLENLLDILALGFNLSLFALALLGIITGFQGAIFQLTCVVEEHEWLPFFKCVGFIVLAMISAATISIVGPIIG